MNLKVGVVRDQFTTLKGRKHVGLNLMCWNNFENYRFLFCKHNSENNRKLTNTISELYDVHRHDVRTVSRN